MTERDDAEPINPTLKLPVPPGSPAPGTGAIDITSEDLAAPEITERVAEMKRGEQVALVREVGTVADAKGGGTLQAVLILTAGGAVGGLIAFALLRLLLNGLELFDDNAFASNLTFTFTLAFFIGTAVALADVIATRSWAKLGVVAAIVIPTALGAGLVMGLIAHFTYDAGVTWIFDSALEQGFREDWTEQQFQDFVVLRLHPIRGVAWMFVGVAAGVAAGAAARSWKRVGIAAAGGAIGGFLGGFIFDFLPQSEGGEFFAQLIGIVLLGTLIGLATGLVEQAAKSRWIEIVSGGLAGKQFILYKRQITLGSSPQADITIIKDPAIPPVAAVIDTGGGQARLSSTDPMIPAVVNGVPQGTCTIADGDIVTLGSSQLRFREKATKSQVPGALRDR